MRVVVTGASGFIGTHLTAALLAKGTLAGRDGRQHAIRDASDAAAHFAHGMEVNLHGMLRLPAACRLRADVRRFVFTSSIAAFGGPLTTARPRLSKTRPCL